MKGNAYNISTRQTIDISQYLKQQQTGVDLNYLGIQHKTSIVEGIDDSLKNRLLEVGDSNEQKNYEIAADVNRVKAWLTSLEGDYSERKPNAGGAVFAQLGQHITLDNIDRAQSFIINKFNQDFSNDLQALHVKLDDSNLSVAGSSSQRSIKISIIFMDVESHAVSGTGTEIII